MTTVQTQGLLNARERMIRAKREFESARLREVAYRGVHYDMYLTVLPKRLTVPLSTVVVLIPSDKQKKAPANAGVFYCF